MLAKCAFHQYGLCHSSCTMHSSSVQSCELQMHWHIEARMASYAPAHCCNPSDEGRLVERGRKGLNEVVDRMKQRQGRAGQLMEGDGFSSSGYHQNLVPFLDLNMRHGST